MKVEFVRGETRRYRSRLHRRDGVVVEFEGGSYNKIGGRPGDLPHDVAHLIVETALGLDRGVWGTLAAGGLFNHATVVSGRQAPQAAKRGREIVKANRESVMEAEFAVRRACDAMIAGEEDAQLRAAAEAWARLAPGEVLSLPVPDGWAGTGRRGTRRGSATAG